MNDTRSLSKLTSAILQGCRPSDILRELETLNFAQAEGTQTKGTQDTQKPKQDDTTDDTTNDDPPGCTMWGGISAFG